MKGKCRTSSRRRALTLVEVVAGLALLSMLLVGVLTLKARVARQSADTSRRLQALAAADRLLAEWWTDRARFPRNSSGRVERFAWRTTPVRNEAVEALVASVIRLEVLDEQRVLASVEIVLDDDTSPRTIVEAR